MMTLLINLHKLTKAYLLKGLSFITLQVILSSFFDKFSNNLVINEFFSLVMTILITIHFIKKNIYFSYKNHIKSIFYDLFSGLIIAILLVIIMLFFLYIPNIISNPKINPVDYNYLIIIVYIFSISALNEELLFRLLPLNLLEISGKKISIIISSIMFSIAHIMNPNINTLTLINLFLTGLFLGVIYFKFKSIWVTTGVHIGWNLLETVILGFRVSGLDMKSILEFNTIPYPLLTGGEVGLEGSIVYTIVIFLAFIYFLLYRPLFKDNYQEKQ